MQTIFAPGIFKGRVAIVTGGGSGIGLAIARLLGSLGARVAICGRNQEKLDLARVDLESKSINVFAQPCDIRDVDQIATFVDAVKSALGPANILINNAGGQFPIHAEDLTPRGWEAVIRNNLNGTFFMSQAVATKHMFGRKSGESARIISITANVARGFPGMIHTGAARAGVENMTKTLAIEWAHHDIQINSIAPGIIETSGTEQYPRELVEGSRKRTPAKRLGTAEEVAELVAYMASDAASFVTGCTWYIDGGSHLWGEHWPIPEWRDRA
jgi:citronellol/citronellal dehydrogenase